MWDNILTTLWFFLPAGLANMTPILAAKLPLTSKFSLPLDLGRKYKGKRIFGDNKTYRGFIVGIIVAFVTLMWQRALIVNGTWSIENTWFDYASTDILLLSLAFGFGALAGDAIESFVKRQLNKSPGQSWFPFDQIDYILGGLLFSTPITGIGLNETMWVLVIWFLLHPISTAIGFVIGLKDKPI